MITKVYGFVGMLGLLAVAFCYLTGNLTPVMTVVFGFLSFAAIVMGIMNVLPEVAGHRSATKH
jgi:hypothetical protein